MNTTELITIEAQERITKALEFFNSLREVKVTNQAEYDGSAELIKKVKATIKELEADRIAQVKPFKDKATKIDQHYREVRLDLENAERLITKGMTTFYAEVQRKIQEEQRRLDAEAEAKRKAEMERAEQEQKKAEAYREDGKEFLASRAEARAEAAETRAFNTVAPTVEAPTKTQGISMRKVYKVIVENKQTAIANMLSNTMLQSYIDIDLKAIERLVNASKGSLQLPEGFKIVTEYAQAVRVA